MYRNVFLGAILLSMPLVVWSQQDTIADQRLEPIYAMLRTGFSSRPTLLFMDLRGGVVLNNVGVGKQQTSPYVSTGVGVNLATGATFKSYIVLSYVYNGMDPFKKGDQMCDVDGLSMACLRIGINF